jgi:hypothetical protein
MSLLSSAVNVDNLLGVWGYHRDWWAWWMVCWAISVLGESHTAGTSKGTPRRPGLVGLVMGVFCEMRDESGVARSCRGDLLVYSTIDRRAGTSNAVVDASDQPTPLLPC